MDTPTECIFCKIADKQVPSNILFEGENVMIIQDIMPKAPVHAQVISKKHIRSLNDVTDADSSLIGEMILAAKNYAAQAGVSETGFKLVMNTGKEGGQVIPHWHIHLLGGKQLEE